MHIFEWPVIEQRYIIAKRVVEWFGLAWRKVYENEAAPVLDVHLVQRIVRGVEVVRLEAIWCRDEVAVK